MESPQSPTDAITSHLRAREYPVVTGTVEGNYSVDDIIAFENELRRLPDVTTVSLGKSAGCLTYLIDTRHQPETA